MSKRHHGAPAQLAAEMEALQRHVAPEAAPPPVIDARRLVALIRQEGPDRDALLAQAYAMTFHTELGRIVLLDHLTKNGVGRVFGHEMTEGQLRYSVGLHDAAVMLANDAGFDATVLAAIVITDELTEEHGHAEQMGYVARAADEF